MGYFEHMDLYSPRRYEPRNDRERAEHIMRLLARDPATEGSPAADAADYGGTPSAWPPASESLRGAGVYRREYLPPEPPPDAIRSLGDEMVMLVAGFGGGAALARGLPYAVRMGRQGIASLSALGAEAAEAATAVSRSFMNRLGRHPTVQELVQALGLAPDIGVNRAEGLGNPFRGRTPEQVNEMMQAKGFEERWQNPDLDTQRSYRNLKTGRSYYIEPVPKPVEGGVEYPHVDAHRPRSFRRSGYQGSLERKRRWPLGERLYDWE
jgi:hypothetical protein